MLEEKIASINYKIKLILLLITIFLVTSGILIYLRLWREAQASMNKLTELRILSISRSGAQMMVNFVDLTRKSIVFLSLDEKLNQQDAETQETLGKFIDNWQNSPLTEVLVIDKYGKLVNYASNTSEEREDRENFSDSSYYNWAKKANRGEIFIEDPYYSKYGTYNNQYLFHVASPIINRDEFNGLVVGTIQLRDFAQKYIEPLRIYQKTQVFLLDERGNIIYAPFSGIIGINLIDLLKNDVFPGSRELLSFIVEHYQKNTEGTVNLVIPDLRDQHLKRFVITYTPVQIQGVWVLSIATPTESFNIFQDPLYRNQVFMLFFVLLVIVGSVLVTFVVMRIVERNAYEVGFAKGGDYHIKK